MFIQGVGSATPPNKYTQGECWEALKGSDHLERLSGRSQAILRKVLSGDTGIQSRYFAMEDLAEAFSLDPDTLHARFANSAPSVATEAARKALDDAGIQKGDIDALIISTCTGYLCPGLTSYVSENLGLNSGIFLADLVGHGCGAALPNLQMAEALIASGRARHTLSICVEICSAAFYLDNDPGVLISACLFGDGAAAAVTGNTPGRGRSVRWKNSSSVLNPRDRNLLKFETRGGMLRNVLDKSVPLLVVEHLEQTLQNVCAKSNISKEEINEWILHSGGRDVLAAVRTAFNLDAEKLGWSASVLRDYGNISSPSVLVALERALRARAPAGTWLMASFGAGISCHAALCEVE